MTGMWIDGPNLWSGLLGNGWTRKSDGNSKNKPAHHAPPSPIGRTFTTFIMPACMWYSKWQ